VQREILARLSEAATQVSEVDFELAGRLVESRL